VSRLLASREYPAALVRGKDAVRSVMVSVRAAQSAIRCRSSTV
jgi:hypothetical protein